MIFNELLYPLVLLISVSVFFVLPISWRGAWICLTGMAFYGYYAEAFLLLFALEGLLIFALVRRFHQRRDLTALAVLLAVALLGYFKYRNMLLMTWHSFQQAGFSGLMGQADSTALPELPQLILPLAISFFTFEFIQYAVDSHRKDMPEHSFVDFMAFLMFFPTLIAGPIKRFQDFVPQMASARFSWLQIQQGSSRILIGLAKKMIIADSLDPWVQPLLSSEAILQASPTQLGVALLAYAIKIYLDFSGYSDIAIGSARLFGIAIPENFDHPYLRPNIALFWRHWHMSLTHWITTYVFIPLGGSRAAMGRVLLNLMIAMGVSGLWHGAAWHFVFWGLYHGLLLGLHRLYKTYLKPRLLGLTRWPRLYTLACTLLTFGLVTLGWGLFIMPLPRFGLLLQQLFWPGG